MFENKLYQRCGRKQADKCELGSFEIKLSNVVGQVIERSGKSFYTKTFQFLKDCAIGFKIWQFTSNKISTSQTKSNKQNESILRNIIIHGDFYNHLLKTLLTLKYNQRVSEELEN